MRAVCGFVAYLFFVFGPTSHLSANANENSYFPLTAGMYSPYTNGFGPLDVFLNVLGVEDFYGRDAWVIMRGNPYGFEPFYEVYSIAADGDVLYHGRRFTSGDGVLFEHVIVPPNRIIDMPVFGGKSWADSAKVYRYQDGALVEIEDGFTYSGQIVNTESPVDVPAGSFMALEVTGDWGGGATRYWFAEETGIVQMEKPNGTIESLTGPVVADEQHSWGAVKALYR